MMADIDWYSIEVDVAAAWVRDSLADGGQLSALVLARIDSYRTAEALLPDRFAASSENSLRSGIGASRDRANQAMAGFFDTVAPEATLLVEDDLWRPGDTIPGDYLVREFGERLIRFAPLNAQAVELLGYGSSGFPLNAFVAFGNSADLASAAFDDDFVDGIRTIIVSVLDGESYLRIAKA